mgnify:CR=1 FL=1
MPGLFFLNGDFVSPNKAVTSIFGPGFLYGQGLFETMRSYNGRIFRSDSHIERLINSAPLIDLNLEFDKNYLKDILISSLKKSGLKSAYLRLTVWQGQSKANCAVFVEERGFFKREDYEKGFKAIISGFRQNEFSPLSGIKSSSYLYMLLAYKEARKKGADEALLLNTKGFIAEASRANIFLVKDNCLVTPLVSCGCLPGITRDTVLDIARKEKIKTFEEEVTPEDLARSEEAFLTNSLIEVMPLVIVEGAAIKKGSPGKITETILKRYRGLTEK